MRCFLIIFSVFGFSIASFAGSLIYSCHTDDVTLQFVDSDSVGKPALYYAKGDLEIKSMGSSIEMDYMRPRGIRVFLPLDHKKYLSMLIFFPFPTDENRLPWRVGESLLTRVRAAVRLVERDSQLVRQDMECIVRQVTF